MQMTIFKVIFFLEAMKRKRREGEGEDEEVTFYKVEEKVPLYIKNKRYDSNGKRLENWI